MPSGGFGAAGSSGGTGVFSAPEDQALLDLLHLLDWTLVAALVVMVILSSWDSLVSPFDEQSKASGMTWIRKLDPGNLKVKLANPNAPKDEDGDGKPDAAPAAAPSAPAAGGTAS